MASDTSTAVPGYVQYSTIEHHNAQFRTEKYIVDITMSVPAGIAVTSDTSTAHPVLA